MSPSALSHISCRKSPIGIARHAHDTPLSDWRPDAGDCRSRTADKGDEAARGHAAQTAGGNQSVERYYDLSATDPTRNLCATLPFPHEDAEVPGGFSESNLERFKRTSGTWMQNEVDSRSTPDNIVTLNGIDSFSQWPLGSRSTPVPGALSSFEGTRPNEGVRLRWRTVSGRSTPTAQRRLPTQSFVARGGVERLQLKESFLTPA